MSPLSKINTVLSLVGGGGQAVGWTNFGSLSPHLFVKIQDTEYQDMVIGRLVSYSISNESTWENKFEGLDEDSKQPFWAGLIQAGDFASTVGWEGLEKLKGKTLVTEAQSQQIWTGIQPLNVSMEVEFKAFHDAYTEVELPIQYLFRMQSPVLSKSKPEAIKKVLDDAKAKERITDELNGILGDTPKAISIDFLNKRFNEMYVLESMSVDVDSIKVDKLGNKIQQTVSLQFGSVKGITREKVLVDGVSSVIDSIIDFAKPIE